MQYSKTYKVFLEPVWHMMPGDVLLFICKWKWAQGCLGAGVNHCNLISSSGKSKNTPTWQGDGVLHHLCLGSPKAFKHLSVQTGVWWDLSSSRRFLCSVNSKPFLFSPHACIWFFSFLGRFMNERSHWLDISCCIYCGASQEHHSWDGWKISPWANSCLPWKFQQVSACHPGILLSPYP